jgi:hypothetical protein
MDATPHPLVARLVQAVLKRRLASLDETSKQKLAEALGAVPAGSRGALTAAQANALDKKISAVLDKTPDQLTEVDRARLADAAGFADIPDLVTLAGYLGGSVDVEAQGRDTKWWILYLDSQLQNWRLIPDDGILLVKSTTDDSAPFNRRDMIWVEADALTARGEAPPRPEVQAKFLQGEFTRAGDLRGSASGRQMSPQTGGFCDVVTPRCCTKTVRP